MRLRVTAATAMMWCIASACTRHTMLQDFPRAEARLRSAVHPETVAPQSASDPRTIRMWIGVYAPADSAIIVALRHDVPLSDLRTLIGDEYAVTLEEYWNRGRDGRVAPPIMSYWNGGSGRANVTATVHVDSVSWPKQAHWVRQAVLDERHVSAVPPGASFMVVRPGENVRLFTTVTLQPTGFNEKGRYVTTFDWISVPVAGIVDVNCGQQPLILDTPRVTIACGSSERGIQRYPVARRLQANARMMSTNYGQVAGIAGLLALMVAVIARN